MTLQEKLCRLRSREGLSQEDVAEKLNVSRQSVSKWETGQSVPELEKLLALSELYHVSLDDLAREERDPFIPQEEVESGTKSEEWKSASESAPSVRTLKQIRQRRGAMVLLAGVLAFFSGLLFAVLGGGTLSVVCFYGGILVAIIGSALIFFHRVHPLLVVGWAIMFGLALFDQFCGWSLRVLRPDYSLTLIKGWFEGHYFSDGFYGFQLPYLFVLVVLTIIYCWREWQKKELKEK